MLNMQPEYKAKRSYNLCSDFARRILQKISPADELRDNWRA